MESLTAIAAPAEIAPEGAPAADTRKPRQCPECGSDFYAPPKGPGQHKRFCKDSCRVTFGNREAAEGKVLVTIAKAWRKTRGSGPLGKRAFAEMTSILDALIARAEKAGRPGITQRGEGPLRPYLDDVLRDPFMDRDRDGGRRRR